MPPEQAKQPEPTTVPPGTPTVTPTAPGGSPVPPLPGYQLAWEDEFQGTALDTSKWTAMTGPRRDAQNTQDAVAIHDDLLGITTFTEAGVHKTAFLTTEGKFEATYGYFEARVKFQDAPGEWCAFWLQSPTNGQPMGDPARAGVEIDVVEHRVTDQGGWQLADYVALNLNWDGYGPERQNRQRVTTVPGGAALQGQWHTYGLLWTPTGYTFYVDAIPLWTIAEAVSQRGESLQLTCEVDDGSWAGFVPKGGYGDRASSTTGMQVDWVRVWQKAP
jgi:beta-glucanase (GH16 family)